MTDHIVKSFDADIGTLRTTLAEMAGIAEDQLTKAVKALATRDLALADEVIGGDDILDIREREIGEKAILTITKRQPMASDLREIMVAIRTAADIERIGDLAKNTAKRAHAISEPPPRRLLAGLTRMGSLARSEFTRVLDAYVRRDADAAMEVWRSDEELDSLYNSIFRELLTYMMEDPRNIGMCTHLLFGAKNLERIGDHATNIAENIYYLVHGASVGEGRPKKDITSMFDPQEA
ncbi:MAG: phosphate signaling complex protein PhoU [Alphaproteobacteria bacterium]|nr:phosphate signaling complex protein PhoU [Alphaproteobacteria bacterium]